MTCRVCIVTAAYPTIDTERHGGTTYASVMAHALGDAGTSVEVVCFSESTASGVETTRDGPIVVHRVGIPWVFMVSQWFPGVAEGYRLAQHVRAIEGDQPFAAVEGPNLGGICWALVLRYGHRFWLRMHTSSAQNNTGSRDKQRQWRPWFRAWLDGVTARRASHRITNSEAHAATAREEYRLRGKPVHVVPHGIDDPRMGDHDAGRELVGVIGMLTPRKGPDVVLEAFAQLQPRRPASRLVMIGKDEHDYEAGFRRAHPECATMVEFAGLVDDATLDAWWRRIGIVVVPSRYESFGLVAIEAMARGLPVIVADAGALPEVVDDAALVVPSEDSMALATAMLSLLDDPDLRAEFGAAGRQRYLDRYSSARMGRACATLFCGTRRRDDGVPG